MTAASVPPALIDDSNKIRVGCLVLNFSSLIDVGFRRITQHVIQVWDDRGVTQLGESVSGSFQVSGESGMLVNQKQPRSLLFSLGESDVTRNSIFVFC